MRLREAIQRVPACQQASPLQPQARISNSLNQSTGELTPCQSAWYAQLIFQLKIENRQLTTTNEGSRNSAQTLADFAPSPWSVFHCQLSV
jgi:hypothetical protein